MEAKLSNSSRRQITIRKPQFMITDTKQIID